MDGCFDIVQIGNFRIELVLTEDQKWSVVFTALDDDHRRLIKAPVMENGQIKTYENAQQAISDAMVKFGSFQDRKVH